MAIIRVAGVRLAGLASAVPDCIQTVDDDARCFGDAEARKISQNIGVASRRIAPPELCASDLCAAAAERLLDELGWERESVRALIFVTQTPDYLAPATACTLQDRLGLPKSCAAIDLSMGCSGYVYGLATASQFVRGLAAGENGSGRVLLLVGDTITRMLSPQDRATVLLFGDAGSATALEACDSAEPMVFSLGTDGSGAKNLIVPVGGFRSPRTEQTGIRTERENGNIRSDEDLYMNGAEVFSFTLAEVPSMVKQTMAAAGWELDGVDGVVMHQSNAFMLNHLRKRLKIPDEKFFVTLDGYGNTSCASIPLAISARCASEKTDAPRRLVLAGFGIGWSWGGAAVTIQNAVLPEVVIVPGTKAASREAA